MRRRTGEAPLLQEYLRKARKREWNFCATAAGSWGLRAPQAALGVAVRCPESHRSRGGTSHPAPHNS